MTPFEKVADRVRKLRALSTSSNQNEAAAAAAEAQRLILEYQLDEANLSPTPESLSLVDEDMLPLVRRTRALMWEEILAAAVACANGCVVMSRGAPPSSLEEAIGAKRAPAESVNVIGVESNVACVRFLWPLMHVELRRLGKEAIPRFGLGTRMESYMVGVANAVGAKLMDEREAAIERLRAKSPTALDNDKAMQERLVAYAKAKGAKEARLQAPIADPAAYDAGHAAGSGVNVNIGQQREHEAPRQLGSG